MGELQTKIHGSRAQKDVFRQILLSASIKSGAKADLAQAKQVRLFKLEASWLVGWTPGVGRGAGAKWAWGSQGSQPEDNGADSCYPLILLLWLEFYDQLRLLTIKRIYICTCLHFNEVYIAFFSLTTAPYHVCADAVAIRRSILHFLSTINDRYQQRKV